MARTGRTPRGASWGGLVLVDVPPEQAAGTVVEEADPEPPPLHCRWRLWHTWREHHVPGGGAYVTCTGCGRYMPEPLFARPWE